MINLNTTNIEDFLDELYSQPYDEYHKERVYIAQCAGVRVSQVEIGTTCDSVIFINKEYAGYIDDDHFQYCMENGLNYLNNAE